MKNQKVLITGGLGFIGSNLAHACLKAGAEVTIYDALSPDCGGNLYNIQDIRHKVELVQKDILNTAAIEEHIKGKDIVFNCAATTSHSKSMKDPAYDLETNVRGVLNILEAMRRQKETIRLVQVGTTTQMGRQNTCVDESSPEFPCDMYSAHKSLAEKYVLLYGRAYGLWVTVLRLPNVYGPRSAIKNAALTFNNYFIGLALQGKDITIYGDGKQKRNVLFVDDAVKGLMMASQAKKAQGEMFLCAGDEHYSVGEIARLTAKVMGTGGVVSVPWPSQSLRLDVGDVCLNNAKIKKYLGFKPQFDLTKGLLETKKYFISRLEHYLT